MRSNCLDCLDRTNAVQSMLGLEVNYMYLIIDSYALQINAILASTCSPVKKNHTVTDIKKCFHRFLDAASSVGKFRTSRETTNGVKISGHLPPNMEC